MHAPAVLVKAMVTKATGKLYLHTCIPRVGVKRKVVIQDQDLTQKVAKPIALLQEKS